jgi:hypothetical protein
LKEGIKKISNKNIMANLVISTIGGLEPEIFSIHKFQIIPTFDKLMPQKTIKTKIIDKGQPMFVPNTVKEPLRYYYENEDAGVLNNINIRFSEEDEIYLSMPAEVDGQKAQISLNAELIGAEDTIRDDGSVSGYDYGFESHIMKKQTLRLAFNGSIPERKRHHFIRLSSSNTMRTYRFRIEFNRILPKWAAVVFSIIIVLCFSHLIIIIIKFASKNKIFKSILRKTKQGKQQVNPIIGKWVSGMNEIEFLQDSEIMRKVGIKPEFGTLRGSYIIFPNNEIFINTDIENQSSIARLTT